MTGRVTSVREFGAFVDLGAGVQGLLHVSEMAWSRVSDPAEMVKAGEEITVKVLRVDEEKQKISLGLKQLTPDPWSRVHDTYQVGQVCAGRVTRIAEFGAFVEIEPGIDGLIHISDMSWTKRVQHPSEVVKKGDAVDVVILNIDAENKRISLGLKQAIEDPWLSIGESYPVNTDVSGAVVRLMDKGVVVDIGNDIEGFVPISQLNLGKPVVNPADDVYEGMKFDMRVLEVDPIHRRIVLTVTNVPEDQPPRPETPSKVIPMDEENAPAPINMDEDVDSSE